MRSTVADRGQVTIPKPLRERLGIKPRSILDFTEENGRLVAVKVDDHDPVEAVRGCLHLEKNTDDIMRELRGVE
jgi:AbrB family looped-hinge helix DNA binding protein